MTGAKNIHDVTHAFTLKSRWLTAAILHGQKPLENRSQEWKPGWYAVHTGVSAEKQGDEMETHVRQCCVDDARVSMIAQDLREKLVPKGFIAGFCKISHALPVEAESLADCPWATGPVCMIISETLWLRTPVEHKGQLGTWPISTMVKCALAHQVGNCAIGVWGHDLQYPTDLTALTRMRERNRFAKRKRAVEDDPRQTTFVVAKVTKA